MSIVLRGTLRLAGCPGGPCRRPGALPALRGKQRLLDPPHPGPGRLLHPPAAAPAGGPGPLRALASWNLKWKPSGLGAPAGLGAGRLGALFRVAMIRVFKLFRVAMIRVFKLFRVAMIRVLFPGRFRVLIRVLRA